MKKIFASAFYSDHKYWNRYGWWSYEKSCRNGSRQRCFKILVAAVKVAGFGRNLSWQRAVYTLCTEK